MSCLRRFLQSKAAALKRSSLLALTLGVAVACASGGRIAAQAREGVMSESEVESLRDAAYVPLDRILAYEKILDTRSSRLDSLLKGRRHVSFPQDLHELLDQVAAIADELNDNLDEYRSHHRDVRKGLPKLEQETDRWTKALQAAPEDAEDKVIRKLAVDAVEDVRVQVKEMGPELEAYFKEHPDAEKTEKERLDRAHDPRSAPPK
jgi:hypothetical protein